MQNKNQVKAEAISATTKERLLRLREVITRTGLTRSMLYALSKGGQFPRPINLGPRAVGWLESEIDGWIAARVQTRRSSPSSAV